MVRIARAADPMLPGCEVRARTKRRYFAGVCGCNVGARLRATVAAICGSITTSSFRGCASAQSPRSASPHDQQIPDPFAIKPRPVRNDDEYFLALPFECRIPNTESRY